ncbi:MULTISPECIES: hypothetical protein [Salinibaculum]|uniref:hypothetical protein n=1 Tax=Salinibaculum TaxID=2732368 RepID=UPI0030D43456
MGFKSLLRLGYAGMVVQGLLSVFLPRKAIKLATTGWRAGFENVEELEPREWYVEMTKVLGVGMLAAGLTGLLVSRAEKEGADRAQAEFEAAGESEAEEASEDDDDDDDGPVTVDIEDDE